MQFNKVPWIRGITIAYLGLLAAAGSASAQAVEGPQPRIIVKWKPVPLQQQAGASELKARALRARQDRFGIAMTALRTMSTGAEVIRLDHRMGKADMKQLLTDLASDPAVEYAEEDLLLRPTFTPNDGQFNQQWYAFEASGGLKLPEAWDTSTGSGIRVAVLDTGIRAHADLVPNLIGGYDFISDPFIANDGDGRDGDPTDPGDATPAGACAPTAAATTSTWHGTFVAGIIAAAGNNGNGIVGTAFSAKIVPLRVVGRCGALLSDVVDAAYWAVGGYLPGLPSNPYPAKVVNMSLAAPGICTASAQQVMSSIRGRNAIPVVAAGNASSDVANTLPASCADAITVAATTRAGTRAPYSNFGAGVDVSAPGGDLSAGPAGGIFSTHNSGTSGPGSDSFDVRQGTSFATAHASGVIALLMSKHNLRSEQVEEVLKKSVRPFPVLCSGCGLGILDAAAAVKAAASIPLVASLQGGPRVTMSAGYSPSFIANSTGDIFEYRMRRTNSRGVQSGDVVSYTRYFLHQFAPMGCPGETMIFTLTVVDGLGNTSSFAQTVDFVRDPSGGGLPQSCGF